EAELHPRPAVRNDSRREQLLAVGVRELVEEDAGRTVELRDDDALRSVDDERATLGDERQLAQIDFLLDDVLVTPDAVHFLTGDEPKPRLERGREREVALDALVHRVLGLADVVSDERELEELAWIADREHPGEDLLQAFVAAPHRVGFHLQEVPEALELDFEQIGNLKIPFSVDLAEALAILPTCGLQSLLPLSRGGTNSSRSDACACTGRTAGATGRRAGTQPVAA